MPALDLDPWYSSPVFVVPVIWILFLAAILWATQPWTLRGKPSDIEHLH